MPTSSRFPNKIASCYHPALLVILVICLCSPVGSGVRAAEEVVVDGVLHVRNGAAPSEGVVTAKLQEQWQVGSDEDEHFFGTIADALTDSAGNLYLLDMQLSEVSVYSPDGEFLRTMSREGEGPGEVKRPISMAFLPNGNLALVQIFPGKVVKIAPDGTPAGTFSPSQNDPSQGGFHTLHVIQCRGGHLVINGDSMSQRSGTIMRTSYIASCQVDGKEKVRYLEKDIESEFFGGKWVEQDQYFPSRGRWAVGPDGRVYVAADRNSYTINVYRPEGTLEMVIERQFTPHQRTREEREQIAEGSRLVINEREVKKEIADTDPCLSHLEVRDDGHLWVLHSDSDRDQPEGVYHTWDVFDPRGHFVRQVAVSCNARPEKDRVVFLDNHRAILIRGFEAAARGMARGTGLVIGEDEEESEDEDAVLLVVMCRVEW